MFSDLGHAAAKNPESHDLGHHPDFVALDQGAALRVAGVVVELQRHAAVVLRRAGVAVIYTQNSIHRIVNARRPVMYNGGLN